VSGGRASLTVKKHRVRCLDLIPRAPKPDRELKVDRALVLALAELWAHESALFDLVEWHDAFAPQIGEEGVQGLVRGLAVGFGDPIEAV